MNKQKAEWAECIRTWASCHLMSLEFGHLDPVKMHLFWVQLPHRRWSIGNFPVGSSKNQGYILIW